MADNKHPVSFKLTTWDKFITIDGRAMTQEEKENLVNPTYKTGQMIFVEDKGRLYLDFHDKRTCYTYIPDEDEVHYKGIASSDPTEGEFSINGVPFTNPTKNDIVVFKSKEYLYRVDDEGNYGWFEIGDEDALTWNED